MLEAQRRDEQLLSYTLDRTEYTLDTSALRSCEPGQLWLTAFVVSGIAIGLAFELLHLHAGLGQDNCQTFLLPFCGYVGQCVVGGVWTAAAGTWRDGAWTRTMVGMMLLSSMGNGVAQALDYVALTHAGITLYTILHSSVIFFACGIAAFVLRTPVNGVQWASVLAVVVGLVLTGVPAPIAGHGSFGVGLACAIAGSLSLAASYPLAELVFRLGRSHAPSAEACAFIGSLVNVAAFLIWQLAYTVPRWDALVVAPIADAPQPIPKPSVACLYVLFGLLVGVHSLAFWKLMGTLGTVPAALSKGAQQAATFLLAHMLFCDVDSTECLSPPGNAWRRAQKPVAFVVCFLGCLVYAVVKKKPPAGKLVSDEGDVHGDVPTARAAVTPVAPSASGAA